MTEPTSTDNAKPKPTDPSSVVDGSNGADGKTAVATTTEPSSVTEEPSVAAAATQPPDIHLKGLLILPPRQKPSSSSTTPATAVGGPILLPSLRPDEPVASLRGALTEVVGYAHLTKYRLVVEKVSGGGKQGAAAAGSGSTSGGCGGNDGGKGKSGKKKKGASNSNANNKEDVNGSSLPEGVSPYTLKDALVVPVPSVKSLERDAVVIGTEEEKKGDEEVVLDEYSDLSLLMPFFEDDEKETSTVESAEEGTKGASKPIIKDASSTVAIRVVLERYDMASIRDHVDRVRSLLEGNAPHVKKLFVEEENAAEDTKQADEESKEPVVEGDDKEKSDEVKVKVSFVDIHCDTFVCWYCYS